MPKLVFRQWLAVSLLSISFSFLALPQGVWADETPVQAQATQAHSQPKISLAGLKRKIAQIIADNKGAIDDVGAYVVDEKGKTIFKLNENKLFPPASNLKLYVSALALDRLGPNFRTRTSLYAPSLPDAEGAIKGDLIFYGRGEYNLSGRFGDGDPFRPLEDLADQLVAKGVKKIEGNVIGDDSYFNGAVIGDGVAKTDLQWAYGAEVTALTVLDNAIRLKIDPGKTVGQKAVITVDPPSSLVTLVNKVVTTAEGVEKKLEIKRELESNTFTITGSIPVGDPGETDPMAMRNPTMFAADFLKEVLAKKGIEVTGNALSMNAGDRLKDPLDLSRQVELASLTSIPLREELGVMNKESNNVHAELLIRQVGVRLSDFLTGTMDLKEDQLPTSEKLGIVGIKDLLDRAGIDYKPLIIADGSGLSEKDYVTPATSLGLLRYMAKMPNADLFLQSLPIAGVDGTLKKRFVGTKAEGNLHAKTGTLDNVNALAGYLSMPNGKKFSLAFMVTHKDPGVSGNKLVIDPIVNLLAEYAGQ